MMHRRTLLQAMAVLPVVGVSTLPAAERLIIGYRIKGNLNDRWSASFINEVYPNIDDAVLALPGWLVATGKYMGETVRGVYYPVRGESFDYAVVQSRDAICVDWHNPFIEGVGVVHQPLTVDEIASLATWQN